MNKLLFSGVLLLGVTCAALADDVKALKAVARETAAKTAKAVVTARVAIRLSVGEREVEQNVEATGTVIDASGLTVISASALEPGRGFMGGRRGGGGMPIESEVTGVTLVLEDGTEVDGEVAHKDEDLDIAFLKPRDAKAKLAHVDLAAGEAPKLLDEVFVVGRLGRAGEHALSVSVGTVKAVVKGAFFVCDNDASAGNLGCLVYSAEGKPLGVLVTARVEGQGGGFRGGAPAGTIVARPIKALLELARKVAPPRKDEPKTEPKAEPKKPAEPKKQVEDF